MKRFLFTISLSILIIGLLGCKQNNEDDGHTITNKDGESEFQIAGIITEINHESKSILLELTKKLQKDEEEIWIIVNDQTTIENKKKEIMNFQEFIQGDLVKANLAEVCEESDPRICTAKEILIEK